MANNTGIKTGGRTSGTCNVLTREMREVLKGIISKELKTLPETINALKPEKRIEILLKLLPFVLPHVTPIHQTDNEPWQI